MAFFIPIELYLDNLNMLNISEEAKELRSQIKTHAYTICITYPRKVFIGNIDKSSIFKNIIGYFIVSLVGLTLMLFFSYYISFKGSHLAIKPLRMLNIRLQGVRQAGM